MSKQKEPLKVGDLVRIDLVPNCIFEITRIESPINPTNYPVVYYGKPVKSSGITMNFTRRNVTHRIVKKKKRVAREIYVSETQNGLLLLYQNKPEFTEYTPSNAVRFVKFREVLDENNNS